MSFDLRCTACGRRVRVGYATDALDPLCSRECELYALGWGAIVCDRDEGGWRHFLLGEPVRCGTGLFLQPMPAPTVDGLMLAYGYTKPEAERIRRQAENEIARLADPWIAVRYESPLATMPTGREPPAFLYTELLGHEAVITAHSGMRLRWPMRPTR